MLTPAAAGGRVLERLERLYAIGGGEGANRPALSPAEQAAHDLAAEWMEEAGLELAVDAAGNLVGRLRGFRPDLPEVWTGSHLDTVPRGGRFDGALGVVGGLEAVERAGRRNRTLAVAVFRAEETGCQGSRALCASGSGLPGAFVELHVEQGPVLERRGTPVGVVISIVAYARRRVVFEGRAGHAGTTPMDGRDDALCKAAEFVLRVREAAGTIADTVATVGEIAVEPGAANVVPARTTLSVDARAPDGERLDALLRALALELEPRTDPVLMDAGVGAVLRAEVERLGLPVVELPSGAGHDAGILAAAGVRAGMLFVRSLGGGISHAPEENSSAADVAVAIDVLAGALGRLAS